VRQAMAIVHMPEAIAGLVAMMAEGPDEAQQHAAGAIAHLAVNEDAESIIVHSGGVLGALAFLLAAGKEGAKEEAAAALESLSYSAESAALVAKTEGVIPGLVQLLHTSKGKAIENGIGALQNLAVMADCRLDIAAAPRALVSIANVLWGGSPKAQVRSIQSQRLRLRACSVRVTLLCFGACRKARPPLLAISRCTAKFAQWSVILMALSTGWSLCSWMVRKRASLMLLLHWETLP
jgi:hypothetical protein